MEVEAELLGTFRVRAKSNASIRLTKSLERPRRYLFGKAFRRSLMRDSIANLFITVFITKPLMVRRSRLAAFRICSASSLVQ